MSMFRSVSRRVLLSLAASAALIGGGAAAFGAADADEDSPPQAPSATLPGPPLIDPTPDAPRFHRIRWRRSRALGLPFAGRLVRGVRLPPEGRDFFTWDPVRKRSPNRWWRRYGHDRLIRTLLRVLRELRAAHPGVPRIGVGDISRPRGGDFGPRFGSIGHASHQNGLDVDVYYPRVDGRERRASRVSEIDRELAAELVDRFVHEGARYVFVGPATGLGGPRRVVQTLAHHDDHLHVRLRPRPGGR
jgi:murein endopeptidase